MKTRTIKLSAFLAAVVVLCVAGTKVSRLTQTTTFQGDSLFIVVTGSVANGTTATRSIEATNLVTILSGLPSWPANSVTNAIGTVKTNGVNVSTAATSLDIITGSNTVVYATNTAGAVTVQINSSSSGGGVSLQTNANQFGANTVLTIKDGALVTNLVVRSGLTNEAALGVAGEIYSAGRVKSLSTLYTNIVYVNADGADSTANGVLLTNAVKNATAGSLVVIGAGDYYQGDVSMSLLKDGVDQFWMPGSHLGSGTAVTITPYVFYDLAGALTCNVMGYGRFSLTNASGTIIYLQAESKVVFECLSMEASETGASCYLLGGGNCQLYLTVKDYAWTSQYDIGWGTGSGSKIHFTADRVFPGQDAFEFGDFDNWGDGVFNIRYIGATNAQASSAFQLGGRTVATISRIDLWGNRFITGQASGTTNGILFGAVIQSHSTNTTPTISSVAIGRSGGMHLKQCTIIGPAGFDPITISNSTTVPLVLENCSIAIGANATNWARSVTSPAYVDILGNLTLTPYKAAHANVTVRYGTNLTGKLFATGVDATGGTVAANVFQPLLATSSRVAIVGADGTLTNAPAGSAGQYLKQDLTWDSPAGSGDVTAAATFDVDNRLIRSDGTGKGVQFSKIVVEDNHDMTGVSNITMEAGALLIAPMIRLSDSTASRAAIINAQGDLTNSTVTATELGYVSGVTSALQTQLDSKASTALAYTIGTNGTNYTDFASSNRVRLVGGTGGITVSQSGSGGVQTWTINDDDAGGGATTNFAAIFSGYGSFGSLFATNWIYSSGPVTNGSTLDVDGVATFNSDLNVSSGTITAQFTTSQETLTALGRTVYGVDKVSGTAISLATTAGPDHSIVSSVTTNLTFSGTPIHGQRISLTATNSGATNILIGFPSSYSSQVGSNVTSWTVLANNYVRLPFWYSTNQIGGGMWLLDRVLEYDAQLAVSGPLALSTNALGTVITLNSMAQGGSAVLTNLAGVSQYFTNGQASSMVLSNLAGVAQGFTNYTRSTNIVGVAYDYGVMNIATNGAQTNLTINFSPGNTNHLDIYSTNWWTQWTNISGLATGNLASKVIRFTPSAPGQNTTNIWPSGSEHGLYRWMTNANSTFWNVLTNGKTYVVSMTAYGTNIHATMTLWEP